MNKKWLSSLIGLSMFAMIGRLLGFLRETLIAATFGATAITDAYLTTLLLFDLAIAANVSFLQGSLAYSAGAENRDQFLTWLYKSGYKIALGIILCAAVLFPAIKYIMPLIFTHSPEATETMTISSQLFLFMAAFTTSSGLFSAILQIKGNLTNPGRLIVYLNTFSILFLIFFHGTTGIAALPLGFLAGAMLFFTYQIFLLRRKGFNPFVSFKNKTNYLKGWFAVTILISINAMIPSALGLIERYFALGFTEGTYSHYQFALKILFLPFTIFTYAISASLLPVQVQSIKGGDEKEFNSSSMNGIIISVITSAFFVMILFALAEPIIRIIYMHGQFTIKDMHETASALRILSLGLVPYFLGPIIATVFFSKNAVKKIIIINLSFIIAQALSLTLFSKFVPGITALSANFSIIGWLNTIVLLFYVIRKKYLYINKSTVIKLTAVFIISFLAACISYAFCAPFFDGIILLTGKVIIWLIISGILFFLFYSLLCFAIFRKELKSVLKRN